LRTEEGLLGALRWRPDLIEPHLFIHPHPIPSIPKTSWADEVDDGQAGDDEDSGWDTSLEGGDVDIGDLTHCIISDPGRATPLERHCYVSWEGS
jgi:hypothetical protein